MATRKSGKDKIAQKKADPIVILRDGSEIKMGDEVQVLNYRPNCEGKTFIVCEINPYPGQCESGFMVVVHLKGDPERKILGFKKEGYAYNHPPGIDGNYLKKL